MAEVLVEYPDVIVHQGVRYRAHACGSKMADGLWQGWLEFMPLDGGAAVRSPRETTQPNHADAVYWATGITAVYLEGALGRALNPRIVRHVETDVPLFDEPAPPVLLDAEPRQPSEAVLDPFAVYDKEGETPLRKRLTAFSPWHLVNIVRAYELSDEQHAVLSRLPAAALIDIIASAVVHERARPR